MSTPFTTNLDDMIPFLDINLNINQQENLQGKLHKAEKITDCGYNL